MEVSAKLVMELRQKTGAGMMDCKKALAESNNDIEAATDYLRTKGILKASKKTGRATREGQVASYIHPGGKVGVLIEINCETDFAARTEKFNELVRNIAMQVAAANPVAVRREDIPAALVEREKEIYKTQAKESGKPEKMLEKIVEGKLNKFFADSCLMEQAFVKDPDKTIEAVLKSAISDIGENINIARFARFQLGETAKAEEGEE